MASSALPDLIPSSRALWTPALRYTDLGEDQTLVTRQGTGQSHVLSNPEQALLRALQRPCEASDLLARLEEVGWDDDALDQVPDLVKSLVDRGLIQRLGDLAAPLGEPPGEDPEGQGKAVRGIPVLQRLGSWPSPLPGGPAC